MEKTKYTFGSIHTTQDYFLFKPIDGNRNKNPLHMERLKKSIEQNYLFTVIIVNEKFEIIDGQHRFQIIKDLGLPLNYVTCSGYGLEEVHILNQNSKTWNADDYMDGYCSLGKSDYIIYKKFKEKYDFGHDQCMAMLNGSNYGRGTLSLSFKNGQFKVKTYERACEKGDKIVLLQPLYEGYKRSSFMRAMLTLLDKEDFDFEEFLQKIKIQPSALTDCTTTKQYLALIEEIYNYRRREKVNLRF